MTSNSITAMPPDPDAEVLELSNGIFAAKIFPAAGGNMFSLRHLPTDTPLLREPSSPEMLFQTPECFGIPPLFPPNRIEDGAFIFEDRICRLPVNHKAEKNHLHGLAVNKPWFIHEAGKDFAELEYKFSPVDPEYDGFPFAFTLTRRYELTDKGLYDTLTVCNDGKWTMPLGLGFHTAFPADPVQVRMGTGEARFEIGYRNLPTGRMLPWDELDPRQTFDPAGRNAGFHTAAQRMTGFDGTLFHGAELTYPQGILRYTTDEKLAFWYTWNAGGEQGFICLEPVSWVANALNLPLPPRHSGLRKLAAGEKEIFTSTFEFFCK